VAIACSTAFIIASFALSYFLWGHNGLPIGWDTPYYIGESKIVASQGPLALISIQGPYDLVYQWFSGFLVWTGVSPVNIEIYLPVTLSAVFPYLLSRLTLIHSDVKLATLVTIATPGWYAIYKIGADLHANLLGLIFMLTAIVLISRARSIRQPGVLLGLTLIGLASFTHIETALFFVAIMLVSSVSALSAYSIRVALSAVAVTVPAAVLYAVHLLQLLGLSGGTLAFYGPQSALFWLIVFGPLIPLAVFGLYTSIVRRTSWLEVFVATWAVASITIGVSDYFTAQTFIFAQRAAIIVPTPFLAAIGLRRLQLRTDWPTLRGLHLKYSAKRILAVAFLVLVVSWPLTYAQAANENQKVFLSSSAFLRLQWIENNLKFPTAPIFVYNDLDPNAGGLGNLYDNWVSAIVGPHLAYLGQVSYLVQLQETPFSNLISRTFSASLMKQIAGSGITNRTILLEHPIVLVEDFYNPPPLPMYVANLFHEVSDGVFEGNNTSLEALQSITLPLYSGVISSIGPWNMTRSTWTQSGYSLDAMVDSKPTTLEAFFLLSIPSNDTYIIGFRYWDGIGSGLRILADGVVIGNVDYHNTGLPELQNFTGIHLTHGVYRVTIEVIQNPVAREYASLDYLVVKKA
jgi:hypothetical protein